MKQRKSPEIQSDSGFPRPRIEEKRADRQRSLNPRLPGSLIWLNPRHPESPRFRVSGTKVVRQSIWYWIRTKSSVFWPYVAAKARRTGQPRCLAPAGRLKTNSSCTPSASLFASRRWRLLGCGAVRITIGQALADDPPQRASGTRFVIDAQPDPIGVAEVKFSKVAV